MKSIYYIKTIMFFVAILAFANVCAEETFQSELSNININQVGASEGDVVVDFNILFENVKVKSTQQIVLTPVLKSDSEGDTKELPSVVINGKRRHKLYKRSMKLYKQEEGEAVYGSYKAPKKNEKLKIDYNQKLDYEPWMYNSSLSLVEDICGCAGNKQSEMEGMITALAFPPKPEMNFDYNPHENFIVPPKEEIKQRAESGEAYLIFKVNKWDILPDLENNREELAKIERSLMYVREESTTKITGISIKAYASPEGTYKENLILSKKRAASLESYIEKNYQVPPKMVVSEGIGENWDGLVEMIKNDPKMEHKKEVLHIIETVDIFSGREKQLMELASGKPYMYMMDKFFPLLRRSDYKIEYTVPSFTVDKSSELIQTKPNMLSLEELYQTANRHSKGSNRYNEVFEIALQTYPRDKIANINAAAVAISKADYARAEELLKNFIDEPEAWNNLGIVYMNNYQFEDAEYYLQKAKSNGVKEASLNLMILPRFKKAWTDYQEQIKEYELYINK